VLSFHPLTRLANIFGVLLLLLAASPAHAEEGAILSVRIEGVAPEGGTIRVGIYLKSEYDKNTTIAVVSLNIPATPPVQEETFAEVPPGIYAVQVYQDINSNGHMDFDWAGLPVEPYGFSRDATPLIGKPDFTRAQVSLAPGKNFLVIHLQNTGHHHAARVSAEGHTDR
jgi:uncharacterized protein (DUF2141 family)